MIKVFYSGWGFYRRLSSSRIGTPTIEPLHGKNYLLFDHDVETLNLIGSVIVKSLLDADLEKTIVNLTDKYGNPDTFTLTKDKIKDIHENGNSLMLIFDDELAPFDDITPTEKPLSERERATTLNIIYGLLELLKKSGKSQNEIINELVTFDYRGLKKSTLENYFSKANKINERG